MLTEEIRAQISVERVRADVEHITSQIPSRLAGSENGRRMAEYSLDTLSAAGVTAQLYAMPGLVSFRTVCASAIRSPNSLARATMPSNP